MEKVVLFAFQGEAMCFMHVLLLALDFKAKGKKSGIVIEGMATKLIPEMAKPDNPLNKLYQKARAEDVITGACRACSAKMGVTEAVEAEGLTFLDDMAGHPSMSRYVDEGYEVITF